MPHGAFLFNIAQCHRQLKNHSKAIFFYEGYLRETPDAPNKEEVTVFLKEHKESLKIQDAPTPAYLDKSILAEDDDTEMDLLLKDARPQMVANLNQESTAPPVQAVPSDESVVQKDESSPAVSETEEVYETVVEVVDRPTATAIFDPKAFFKANNPWLWGAVGGIVLTGAAVTGILLSGNIEGLGNETPSTEPPSPSEDPPEEGSLGDLDFRGNP